MVETQYELKRKNHNENCVSKLGKMSEGMSRYTNEGCPYIDKQLPKDIHVYAISCPVCKMLRYVGKNKRTGKRYDRMVETWDYNEMVKELT